MKKLLLIHFKENKNFSLILLAVLGISTAIFTMSITYDRYERVISYGIGGFLNILAITIMVIMINSFIFSKRKQEIDFYYSLAASKRKLIISKVLYDLILFSVLAVCAFVIYSLTMWINVDFININLGKLILYFLLGYLLIILSYLFLLPFFYYGNSTFDGFVYVILAIASLFIISLAISNIINYNNQDYFTKKSFNLLPYYLIKYFSTGMEDSLADAVGLEVNLGIDFIISLILPFVFFASFMFTLRFDENERAGQISNKIFGYKTFIPILTYSLTAHLAMAYKEFRIIYIGIAIILHFILILISQRGFKITKKTLFIYLVEMIVLVISYFGINNLYY